MTPNAISRWRNPISLTGLVGDTYTITLTGHETDGRFCIIDMHTSRQVAGLAPSTH
jgi:hypothetical protein